MLRSGDPNHEPGERQKLVQPSSDLLVISQKIACLPARRVAEALDDFAAGNRMKLERIHEMVVSDILAQGSVISAEHLLRAGGVDSAPLPGAAGVKQQR